MPPPNSCLKFKSRRFPPFFCFSAERGGGEEEEERGGVISRVSKSQFLDPALSQFLTRTVWWVIPLIWLPVICWLVSMSIQMGHPLPQVALMVVAGIFVWTLMEYSLHRFLFHINTKSYWGNTLHYLLHGCHHKHPMDGLRLVFPPAATAILCVPIRMYYSSRENDCSYFSSSFFCYWLYCCCWHYCCLFCMTYGHQFWNLFKLVSTPSTAPAFFGGGLLGYVMYDVTHYYLHHGQPSREVARNLKRYHLNHHFRIQSRGFGITSSLWDKVFRTLPTSKATDKKT
ncbi:dihydroceramide fatty acyl 2-hydroxylase FAH1-like isoform X2 [Magnolia sinica]|uniref:dihydroceramide fatty acyl 2-hydroxylase FAH1-like isoform X2 n=1 Tax=Magnolia sinica TaxID=86752 RepID=UPI00265B0B4E|nr:dihydroceramide fatty acyl 2-hydroxylase FAH1-like isoform X2 [Magnolia sinica]